MKKCVELLQKPTMGVTCNSQNAIILENFFKRPWIKNGERFAVCSVISLTVQKASDVSGLSAGMAIRANVKIIVILHKSSYGFFWGWKSFCNTAVTSYMNNVFAFKIRFLKVGSLPIIVFLN